jgi:heme a synthase
MKLSKSLRFLAVLIFFLIVVGGLVRNLGAGLSCPDWPLCQGRLIPQLDLRVFAEYFHRLFAAGVSIITLAVVGFVFFNKPLRAPLGRPALLAICLLLSQVILGGLTVLKLLQSEIVTLHLATGTLFFATVIYMALKSRSTSEKGGVPENAKTLGRWGLVALTVVYLQIVLGGIVSSHYAGLACPDFPTCLGQWWPTLLADSSGAMTVPVGSNVHIQFAHRIGATLVFVVGIFFGVKLFKGAKEAGLPPRFQGLAAAIIFLVLTQVTLGIGNVIWRLPVAMSVAHLAVAEGLFALVLISTYEIRHFKLS